LEVTLCFGLSQAASRPDFTWTSYTVSNEERSLNPVGRAITTDYWGDRVFPRYFCTLLLFAYTMQSGLCERSGGLWLTR